MDVRIIDLVKRFDTGEIRLPLMQRDYVWRPAKVGSSCTNLRFR